MNRVIPQDQSFNMSVDQDVQLVEDIHLRSLGAATGSSGVDTATDMVSIGNNIGHAHIVNDQPGTSTQRTRQRLLHFSVHFQDRIVQLEIPDTGTVGLYFIRSFHK